LLRPQSPKKCWMTSHPPVEERLLSNQPFGS
jgi:hypothetical protein